MKSVPPEIIIKIFEHLPTAILASFSVVCKLWRSLAADILYTTIVHTSWKPKRVSICLHALSSNIGGSLSTIVRQLTLNLWSPDPGFSQLLVDALMQTKRVIKLKLSMSETFSHHFEDSLLERGIIAYDSVGEGQPELWSTQFLPQLEELELSHGYRPFQLAAGRPIRSITSLTHMGQPALEHLLPFLQRSRGPIRSIRFHLTARDIHMASRILNFTSMKLPHLTHVFFNFFVGKRAHPPRFTPDLLEDLSTLLSLQSVELKVSRQARSPDPNLYSHFAAVHTLKASAASLTCVVLDTIKWCHRGRDGDGVEGDESGWSPVPSDPRTHGWWLGQYGDPVVAHDAMVELWGNDDWYIPLPHEIARNWAQCDNSRSVSQMSINEI